MITYRGMTPADIPAGLNLCRLARWNQLARDWELFLQLNSKGCKVAIDGKGNVIGTVTTIPYENHFAWIGMVLVDPSRQRQGIGTQLLNEALESTAHHETIKLDATPAGREVYLKLGFVGEYNIIRMVGCTTTSNNARAAGRSMTANDFPSLLELDTEAFGANRQGVLEWNFSGAPEYAFVVEEGGRLQGYCLGRHGHDFDQIGPIVAKNYDTAIRLLSSALRQAIKKPIVVDILVHTPEWMKFVLSIGFVELRPLLRMYRGPNNYPGFPMKQFAILGPEFG